MLPNINSKTKIKCPVFYVCNCKTIVNILSFTYTIQYKMSMNTLQYKYFLFIISGQLSLISQTWILATGVSFIFH